MKTAFLGLGTNIGNRKENLDGAVEALGRLPKTTVAAVSSIYETEPWGYTEQADFLNLCVRIETELSPHALLGACLGIEAAFGRERPFPNAPRILDIDVLLYEDAVLSEDELTLPHPRMNERGFVLVPFKDILPNLRFCGVDFTPFYASCDKSGVQKYLD